MPRLIWLFLYSHSGGTVNVSTISDTTDPDFTMVVVGRGPVYRSIVNISVPPPDMVYFQEQWRDHARLQVDLFVDVPDLSYTGS